MNIFYLSENPNEAAELQYNKHVVKMVLETAQILCTTHHELLGDDADVPYKSTHKNHPSTVWARQSANNYQWLFRHFVALCKEYERRYGKVHLSYTKCNHKVNLVPRSLHYTGLTKMPQCMPEEYHDECSVQAYWNYYVNEKSEIANQNTEEVYACRPSSY